jgi:hypothetical protein
LGELVRSFEQTFRIPPGHRLEQVKTRACGGVVRGTYWEHEEYAATGRLVARYHSFVELSDKGEYRCGWRKYDSNGHLLAAEDLTSSKNKLLLDEV